MKNNVENPAPTFDQVPAMLADLSRKFDLYVSGHDRPARTDADSLPMGVTLCAEFLSEIEGKEVTTGAVYNRVAKGLIPFHKNGARLLFLKEEILAAMLSMKVNRVAQFHEIPS